MSPRFFIDRPIFATVLSVLITLAGGLAVFTLPVSQYPQVTPPTIQVDCNYPGANAKVVADTVAAPIEQQVNGVEDMLYMSSQCTSEGSYTLTVTFKIGTDLNMSQIRVLNRVSLAMPQLPDVVRATGVTTRKRSSEILLTCALSSPDRRYDQLYLSNYAVIRLREELSRLPGVSDVLVFGQRDYSMRVWVDPEKLAARGLTAADVVKAIQEQNQPLVAGQIGLPPVGAGQPFQFPITGVGRLTTVEDFERVLVKVGPEGQKVQLKHVARVEMGAKSEDVSNTFDNKPTVGLAVFLLADANALKARDMIVAKMDEMAKDFPEGIVYEMGYDTTPFIRESIEEVFTSLWESIALVAVVVLIFLQSWRAAIIPLAAVPVAIIGTFAAMAALGYTINNLTLFGLVLAVGIVVDDAIVVVEAVQHQLETGLAPRAATVRAMEDVAGPVMAVGVVLSAVFVPCAFLSGIVGQFFRQFAVTIAVSTLISTFNSLTLSPALCALLLKRTGPGTGQRPFPKLASPLIGAGLGYLAYLAFFPILVRLAAAVGVGEESVVAVANTTRGWQAHLGPAGRWAVPALVLVPGALAGGFLLNPALERFFRAFNWGFAKCGGLYVRTVKLGLRVPVVALAGYAGMVAAGVAGYGYLPTGFIPQQDKGYLIASIQLPDAAAVDRSRAVIARIAQSIKEFEVVVAAREGDPGAVREGEGPDARWVRRVRPVKHVNSVIGNSFVLSAYGSNFGSMFIILEGFDDRRAPDLYADVIRANLADKLAAEIPEAQLNVFGAPAVSGLGRAGGFRFMIEDRSDVGPDTLEKQTNNFIAKAKSLPQVTGLFTVYKTNSPQVFADIDRVACLSKGVTLADVDTVLQGSMGSRYVNDFNRFGRTWQVNVQADLSFRNEVEDIRRLKVRNRNGGMVPLGAVVRVRETSSPLVITRYNMYPAAPVNGNVAAGVSTGDARAALEGLADRELPATMGAEWTELSFIEQLAGRSELRIPGIYTFRGDTTVLVFGLSVTFVFLVLAALYESWAFPLAVILVVPVCVVCSLAAVWVTDPGTAVQTLADWNANANVPGWLKFGEWAQPPGRWLDDHPIKGANALVRGAGVRKQDVNIFTQVGFVVLIGLACKNAILIVEFARVARAKGADVRTAVFDACRLRFRPILMTSVAFILGVFPLAVATGAGSEMRQALGVAVLGGMAGVTLFGIFLTPIFFYLVDRLTTTPLFANRYVRAVSDAVLYAIRFRFVRPLAGVALTAAGAGFRKVTRRKFGA
ncbi:MAG: bepE 1 [Gemmataceae bacterium]|nr:bepE 1 [Gemmataceae bacterium]